MRSIAIDIEAPMDIGKDEDGSSGQTLLEYLKAFLASIGPQELLVLLEQFRHRLCDLGEILDKATVITG